MTIRDLGMKLKKRLELIGVDHGLTTSHQVFLIFNLTLISTNNNDNNPFQTHNVKLFNMLRLFLLMQLFLSNIF